MKRIASHRPSPAMVVALTALFFAVSGVGYAATNLSNGNDGTKAKASKKKSKSKSKPGPAGPAGPQGAAGSNGAAGSPGAITFSGRVNALNTANGTTSFGASTGITSSGPEATMLTLSPAAPLTVTSFSVRTSSVSTDAVRSFNLRANGSSLIPCVVPPSAILCVSSPASVPMPAIAELSISSTVNGTMGTFNAAPADAEFSWTAK
jgi:hypothetical protein